MNKQNKYIYPKEANEIGIKLRKNSIFRMAIYTLKNLRNQVVRSYYELQEKDRGIEFADYLNKIKPSSACIVIAYNTTWTINLMIKFWKKNCGNTLLIIVDNSTSNVKAAEIKKTCDEAEIQYFKLPKNNEKHPNRSHGLALNWSWKNIICCLTHTKTVGFIDHDCIPYGNWEIVTATDSKVAYGVKNPGNIAGRQYWNLWAGYMFFNLRKISPNVKRRVDFTPALIFGLDTGGMNWTHLYKTLNSREYGFAKVVSHSIHSILQNKKCLADKEIEIIDDAFIHLGGASYKEDWQLENTKEATESTIEKLLTDMSTNRGRTISPGVPKAGK